MADRRALLVRGLLGLLTLWIWSGALATHFGADDVVLLRQVAAHGFAGGPWRALDRVVVWLQWSVFGPNPFLYHLTQLLLHALNSQLLFGLMLALGAGLAPAALGAALFSAHPLSFGCVYPPSGLGTLAGLTCLLLAARAWIGLGSPATRIALASVFGVLAALFKETYAPGMLAVAWLPASGKSRGGSGWIPAGVTLLAGGVLVAAALSGPLRGASYGLEPGEAPRALARYADWLFGTQPPVPDFLADTRGDLRAPVVALAGLAFAALAWLALRPGPARALGVLGLAWSVALTLPAVLTPRHLYLYYLYGSLAGFAAMLAAAVAQLAGRAKAARAVIGWGCAAGAAGLIAWGLVAIEARRAAQLPVGPFPTDSFMRQQDMVRNFVADFATARVPEGASVVCYAASVQVGGLAVDSALARNNPIAASTDSGRVVALLGGPRNPVRFANSFAPADTSAYALIYLGNGKLAPLGTGPELLRGYAEFWGQNAGWAEAEAGLTEYLKLRPDDAPAWFNLAFSRAKLGRLPEAREAARRYLEFGPTGQEAGWARGLIGGSG